MVGSSLKAITQTCNEEPPGVISIILDTYQVLIGWHRTRLNISHPVVATAHLITADTEAKEHLLEYPGLTHEYLKCCTQSMKLPDCLFNQGRLLF